MNRVRQGSLNSNIGNTIGFLAGIHLKALTQAQAEETEKTFRENSKAEIYRSIFSRPGYISADEDVCDLYPEQPERKAETVPATLPSRGELSGDLPVARAVTAQLWPKEQPEIIRVEVG